MRLDFNYIRKNLNRILAMFLAACLCIGLIQIPVDARKREMVNEHFNVGMDEEDIATFLDAFEHPEFSSVNMELNKEYVVNPKVGEYDAKWFAFTPATSGEYLFLSTRLDGQRSDLDNYAGLYEKTSNGEVIRISSNDDYNGLLFGIEAYLEAGTQYYLCAGYLNTYSADISYKVAVKSLQRKDPKKAVISLKDGVNKESFDTVEYYELVKNIVITYKDGSNEIVQMMNNDSFRDSYGNEYWMESHITTKEPDLKDYISLVVKYEVYDEEEDEYNSIIIGNSAEFEVVAKKNNKVTLPLNTLKPIKDVDTFTFTVNEEGYYALRYLGLKESENSPKTYLNVLDQKGYSIDELCYTYIDENNVDPKYQQNYYYKLSPGYTYEFYPDYEWYPNASCIVEKANVAPSAHVWMQNDYIDGSCISEGKIIYVCVNTEHSGCENKVVTLPKTDHYWKESYVRGTCKTKGQHIYTCGECGLTRMEETELVPTNHAGTTEIRNAKAATATEDGYTGDKYCTACNQKVATGKAIPAYGEAHEHEWDKEVYTKATCKEEGTLSHKCKVCNEVEVIDTYEIDPDNHVWNNGTVTKVATCKEKGILTRTCRLCGEKKDEPLIDYNNHVNVEIRNAKAATAEAEGYTGDKVCKDCNKVLANGQIIPKLAATVPVASLKITAPSNKIAAGKKVQLSANVLPENATNKTVKWVSKDTKVATVNAKGLVTVKAKTGGKSVVIQATSANGIVATYKITSMKGMVKKVAVTGATKPVAAGKKLKLKAKVTADKGANKKLAWTSSNTKYAKVSTSGVVTTLKAGKGKSVKITAKAVDGSGKAKTVTIKIK